MWKECQQNEECKRCERKRSVGKPRKIWLGDTENGLKKMSVRGCRKITKNRDAWKLILKEARVLSGQ
jgi:hypothetical protein